MSSSLVTALLDSLDADALEALAERLAPHLAERVTSTAADGWLRGADKIAAYIDAPRSRVYALASAGRIAVLSVMAQAWSPRKSDLDAWVRAGGGKRP